MDAPNNKLKLRQFHLLQQYVQMATAPHLGVSPAYKPEGVQRGISMICDGSGVPYGMMPQLATVQIGSSVIIDPHDLTL